MADARRKSPFPGMDPWLEQYWGDVHSSLITYARDQLQSHLPGGLRARIQERVYVELPEDARLIYPDVMVVESGPRRRSSMAQGGIAVAEPSIIRVERGEITETFIEIIDTAGNRVITVIEVLSPVNKYGAGQELYLKKQKELLAGKVSSVEIDLLRGGKRVLGGGMIPIPPVDRTTYQICVHRGWRSQEWEIYRAPLRERLPIISIPLRGTDADVPLDIQSLLDDCYKNGRYDEIDYRQPPVPPLEGDDLAWANHALKEFPKAVGN